MSHRFPFLRFLPVLTASLAFAPLRAEAQEPWSLLVTHRGGGHIASPGVTGVMEDFLVQNTGTRENRVRLSCSAEGGVVCDSVETDRITLAPGESRRVVVRFTASNTDGVLRLHANGQATSSAVGEAPITVSPANRNYVFEPCIENCPQVPYSVWVLDKPEVSRPPNSGPYSAFFSIVNTGELDDTYYLSCGGSGGVTCGTVIPRMISINAGDDREGEVPYSVGSTDGTLVMTATGMATDSGTMQVALITEGAPNVVINNRNDDNWDRSLCLVVGAGPAAFVCGDLLASHSMPGFSTLGRERNLTLVYSSHQAAPEPLVAAIVSTPAGIEEPDSVIAQLSIEESGSFVPKRTATYYAWDGDPRQLSLSFDASSYPTGAYKYEMKVTYIYTGTPYATSATGNLSVVNRTQSALGQGWSVAGVEQLYFNQPNVPGGDGILWVGGDGSSKLYTQVQGTTDRWVAPLGAYRDTIISSGSGYTRHLRYGVDVAYDTQGNHTETINRVGQTTTFAWASNRLTSITVPPDTTVNRTYNLTYDGNNRLDQVSDPGGRVLNATVTAGELVSLVDPDLLTVAFVYDSTGRMFSRTNRRNYTTTFDYGQGLRLTRSFVPDGPTGSVQSTTAYQPWDQKGYASSGSGPYTAVDTAFVYTKVIGPRTNVDDDAIFYIDRWGAPVSITDPLGYLTTIDRDDVDNPARVTQVTYPNNRVVQMQWNNRGNLTEVTDDPPDLQPAVTTYEYDTQPTAVNLDSPVSVTDPDGVETQYRYQGTGTLLPGVLDRVTAPNDHNTSFTYYDSGSKKGLVETVVEQNVVVWNEDTQQIGLRPASTTQLFYNDYGNIDSTLTPLLRRSEFFRDSFQRVVDVYDPMDHRRETVYDVMNRVTEQIVHATEGPAELVSKWIYDEGLLVKVEDPRAVPRLFEHDARGRVIVEIDDQGNPDSTFYDLGGLVDSVRTRRDSTIRNTYDAKGQLLETAWTAMDSMPADSVTYTYDNMGNMLTAATTAARGGNDSLARTYYGNNLLRTERQGEGFLTNTYGYTTAGRRQWYIVGDTGVVLTSDRVDYAYRSDGTLEKLWVRWRNETLAQDTVTFLWDELGRRNKLTYPNAATITFAYDADGRKRVMCGRDDRPGGVNVFRFNHVNDTLDTDGLIVSTTSVNSAADGVCSGDGTSGVYGFDLNNQYNSRHQLVEQRGIGQTKTYQYDDSGNRVASTDGNDSYTYTVPAGTNRMTVWTGGGRRHEFNYRANGSRWGELNCPSPGNCDAAAVQFFAYDGLGRTTDVMGSFQAVSRSECGYEPLGRQYQPCNYFLSGAAHLGYDGDNAVRTGPKGRPQAFTFVHGPGIDDPIMGRSPEIPYKVFFMTDGEGGFISAGKPDGTDATDDQPYTAWGGIYNGTTGQPMTFAAERGDIDSLGFFRNRFYDQRTGRWTQEDPIGVTVLNLYAFNANNPVALRDPFGLCPDSLKTTPDCQKWNDAQVNSAKAIVAAERALGNIHALSFANHTYQGLNEGAVSSTCESLGKDSKYACGLAGYVILNADLPVGLIAALIVHEDQHPLGERLFGKGSRQAGEQCAQKRAANFTQKMSDYRTAYGILNHEYMTGGAWNPNAIGCGF